MGSTQRPPSSPPLPGRAPLPSEFVLLFPPVAHLEQKFRGCPGPDAVPVPRAGSRAVARAHGGTPGAVEKGKAPPGDTGLDVISRKAPGAVLRTRVMKGRMLLAPGEVGTGAGSAAGPQPQPPAKQLQQAGAGSSPAPEEKHPRREVHAWSAPYFSLVLEKKKEKKSSSGAGQPSRARGGDWGCVGSRGWVQPSSRPQIPGNDRKLPKPHRDN